MTIAVENLLDRAGAPPEMEKEVLAALKEDPPRIPSTYFYDEQGSELFETITQLPEYYPTRTELSILKAESTEIFDRLKAEEILELGSGAATKTETLIRGGLKSGYLQRYVALEVSEAYAVRSARSLQKSFPEIAVSAVVADFTRQLADVSPTPHRLVTFLGGTIGNFEDAQAKEFLKNTHSLMGKDSSLLIGIDLEKDHAILNQAYNDSEGVTAAFNRNILSVLNTHLGTSFDVSDFKHVAFYNPDAGRIEMHLEALTEITIELDSEVLSFKQGDRIRTEVSNKYTKDRFKKILSDAGFELTQWHTDPKNWFALVVARPRA